MKTLCVFEIDGVLDVNRRALTVARKVLHRLDHDTVFTTKNISAAHAFLQEHLNISMFPRPAPVFCCTTPAQHTSLFRTLLGQHHSIERLICYSASQDTINEYASMLQGRTHPRTHSFYLVSSKEILMAYSSAVYRQEPK